jgi:alcohol dehydrogenase class IV
MNVRTPEKTQFEFATAGRILFGNGGVRQAGTLAQAELGKRAFLVTGGTGRHAGSLLANLTEQGIYGVLFSVPGEPTTDIVREGHREAREAGCDCVIGLGGGSPIDAAKAIAALLTNGGDPLDYLEVIGRGMPLRVPSAPWMAIPTTAGTGAEVTRNAVLASPEHGVKVSLRSPTMLPRIALVDPELTYSMPPETTASTGLDALTQLIEPFVSKRANPITDGLCREGMVRAARSLRIAYVDGGDIAAREDMAVASLFGGLALANAGLGAAHGFAGPTGGAFVAPHGALCAAFLPHVMRANINALEMRQPDHPSLLRYREIARILTGEETAEPGDGILWVDELCSQLRIPRLAAYGISPADFPSLVQKATVASSMKANPVVLTPGELTEILERAL